MTGESVNGRAKRVALFGLSANPPTGLGGHLGIVRELASHVDEVWVLPVYKHMFAEKSVLLDFEHRVRMCELNFGTHQPPKKEGGTPPGATVVVSRVEQELCLQMASRAEDPRTPLRCGSIDVLRHLKTAHADVEWYWALGADTFADLQAGKWRESESFQQEVKILVVQRVGHGVAELASARGRAELLPVPSLTDVSSTGVRETMDEAVLREALHPDVLAYIVANRLYAFAGS